MKKLIVLSLVLFNTLICLSQENYRFNYPELNLDKGIELHDHNVLGPSIGLLQNNLLQTFNKVDQNYEEADLLSKVAATQMNINYSDEELESSIKKNPFIDQNDALIALSQHYFKEQDFKELKKVLSQIDPGKLNEEEKIKYSFYDGYSRFVSKDFSTAKIKFADIKEIDSRFRVPATYYFASCLYFEEDFDKALSHYRKIEKSLLYQEYIPYYICQILFAQGELKEVTKYGKEQINRKNVKNQNRILLLIGQAYYRQKNYNEALIYLEEYEKNTNKLSSSEFYQLAITQYNNQQFRKALKNFKEIRNQNDQFGQLSNYYLADCYLKLQDKESARSSLKRTSTMDFVPALKEESKFNYAKLSMDLKYDAEAITTLSNFQDTSKYYQESQNLLVDLFIQTNDFNRSITTIEKLENKSDKLTETYQILCLNSALQSLSDGDSNRFHILSNKSIKNTANQALLSKAYFWKGLAYQNSNNLEKSQKNFDLYFKNLDSKKDLSQDCKPYKAHYYQAYNYLKAGKFSNAFEQFKHCLNEQDVQNDADIRLDANLRAGDCQFSLNNYKLAKKYYGAARNDKNNKSAYALYQYALIEGLEGNSYDKLITLEEIIEDYPKDEYADNALIQLGDTYTLLGKNNEAFDAYQKLIIEHQDKSPLVNSALLKLGLSSYNQGDASTALKYYKKVMTNNPDSGQSQEALLAIEEIYIQDLGQSNEYITYVKNIPNFDISESTKDSLNYEIAEIQFENEEYSKALKSFEQYLEGSENGKYALEANFYLAECQRIGLNFEDAVSSYDKVINRGLSPFYQSALKNAGVICFHKLKEFKKAYHYQKALLGIAEDVEEKRLIKVDALQSAYKAGLNEEANALSAEVFNSQDYSKEEKVIAAFVIGQYAKSNGKTIEAINAFSYVTSNNKAALAAESSFLLAETYYNIGDFDKSEIQCKSTNTISANYPFWIAKSLLLLTEIYLVKNDLINARAATEAVIENFKEDPNIIEDAKNKLRQVEIREDVQNRISKEDENEMLLLEKGN